MKILINDILFSENNTFIRFTTSNISNEREVLSKYTKEKLKDFLSYLKSLNFTVENFIDNDYKCFAYKNDVVLSITNWCGEIEVSAYINKEYNFPKNQFDKRKCHCYLRKCFDYFLSIKENDKLEFYPGSKIRNIYDDEQKWHKMTSEEQIIQKLRNCWNKEKYSSPGFKLSNLDGTADDPYNRYLDKNGKKIFNGDIKFCRINGYLYKGKVYLDSNQMCYILCNDSLWYCEASWKLFDATPTDLEHKRLKADLKPISCIDKLPQYGILEKDLKKLLHSNITTRQFARIFSNYCEENLFLEKEDKRKKQSEFYYASGKDSGWAKVYCKFELNDNIYEIVFRQNNYIIVMVNDDRIFEICDKVLHYDKEQIDIFYKNNKKLFDKIEMMLN